MKTHSLATIEVICLIAVAMFGAAAIATLVYSTWSSAVAALPF